MNKIESRKTIEKINQTKSQFFEKINKTEKSLIRLTMEKRERTQINKIKNEGHIQSEVSQKEKHQYSILTHIYGI